jgi:hypothetical protein
MNVGDSRRLSQGATHHVGGTASTWQHVTAQTRGVKLHSRNAAQNRVALLSEALRHLMLPNRVSVIASKRLALGAEQSVDKKRWHALACHDVYSDALAESGSTQSKFFMA